MKPKLKKLADQAIVITGATSGIGLTTARAAAERGARLMLIARNGEALKSLSEELRGRGGEALYHAADVADAAALRDAAMRAVERFGGIDTWVNNAGISVYGRLEEVSDADHRRLFETNFWGQVNGSLIAVEYMKASGGALINVGSEASEHSIPLQGMYSASKHAVAGYTDALRIELAQQGAPISVTLIRPTGIDTPFPAHAKNYLPHQPKLPPPIYAPDVVAKAILSAAERPIRDVYCGGPARVQTAANHLLPRVVDKVAELFFFKLQESDEPPRGPVDGSLYEPAPGRSLEERGGASLVQETSAYTNVVTSPFASKLALLTAAAAVAVLVTPLARRKIPAIVPDPT